MTIQERKELVSYNDNLHWNNQLTEEARKLGYEIYEQPMFDLVEDLYGEEFPEEYLENHKVYKEYLKYYEKFEKSI